MTLSASACIIACIIEALSIIVRTMIQIGITRIVIASRGTYASLRWVIIRKMRIGSRDLVQIKLRHILVPIPAVSEMTCVLLSLVLYCAISRRAALILRYEILE